jgi:hypothetical protein
VVSDGGLRIVGVGREEMVPGIVHATALSLLK